MFGGVESSLNEDPTDPKESAPVVAMDACRPFILANSQLRELSSNGFDDPLTGGEGGIYISSSFHNSVNGVAISRSLFARLTNLSVRVWMASPNASISSSDSSVSSIEDIALARFAREARTPSSDRRCFLAFLISGSDLTSSVSRERQLQLTFVNSS